MRRATLALMEQSAAPSPAHCWSSAINCMRGRAGFAPRQKRQNIHSQTVQFLHLCQQYIKGLCVPSTSQPEFASATRRARRPLQQCSIQGLRLRTGLKEVYSPEPPPGFVLGEPVTPPNSPSGVTPSESNASCGRFPQLGSSMLVLSVNLRCSCYP